MAPCEYFLAVSVIVKLASWIKYFSDFTPMILILSVFSFVVIAVVAVSLSGGGGGGNFGAINQHCDNLIPREIICNGKIIRIIRSN